MELQFIAEFSSLHQVYTETNIAISIINFDLH